MKRAAIVFLLSMSLASCRSKTLDLNSAIDRSVRATVAAWPTYTPEPPAMQAPPTAASLRGLFCEYQFCVGHPAEIVLYDVVAKQNPGSGTASRYEEGILAGNDSQIFVQILWQAVGPGTDPQFLLDQLLNNQADARGGTLETIQVGNTEARYIALVDTPTDLLPSGGAAVWTCGDRAFAWKAYTAQSELARSLLLEALAAFRCDS